MMKVDLKGQTAVVYGAGRGIGEAIVSELAKAGAKVYVADLIKENCERVVDALKALGLEGTAVKCDVSCFDEVDAVMEQAEKETGRLDIVVNNAGIVTLGSFLETTQDEISRLIKVNLMGASNGLQAGVRRMRKYDHGKIVSTASFAGRHAMKEGFAYYGMTKAAIIYLTQAAAYAGADRNINVNSICPGIIRTPMWESILDSYVEAGQDRENSWHDSLKHFIPLERGDQKPQDIAYAVLFLCSEYADHITGQALNIDGGASMD